LYWQGVNQSVLPITKLDKLDDLLDAAVVGFACAFIDFSAEDRKHLSATGYMICLQE